MKELSMFSKFWKTIKDDLWIVVLDIIAVNAAYLLALTVRYYINNDYFPDASSRVVFYLGELYSFAPYYTIICIIIFYLFRLYGGLWRYAGIHDMNRIVGANIVTCVVQVAGTLLFFGRMPLSYYAGGAAFQFIFIVIIRFSYRLFVIEKRTTADKPGTAMIIGAGEQGRQTYRLLENGVTFRVACIIDPRNESAGKLLDGKPVYEINELENAMVRHDINCVFLSESGLSDVDREKISKACKKNNIELRDYNSFFGYKGETDSVINDVAETSGRTRKIAFSPPDISESEIGEVVETLKSGWITTGPRTKLLERRLAAYIETGKTDVDTEKEIDRWKDRLVCLNSATASEELNLRILGIKDGDEVIVPAYTYTASASAVVHCGATVKFVDIQKDGDPVTHMPEMDYKKLEEAITERTKAIVVVDLGGIVADYDRIYDIVDKKRYLFKPVENDGSPLGNLNSRIQTNIGRIAVVSDCAHSLGASRIINGEKKYCGSIADFTSFSFHAVKNFTTAEGGASTWKPISGIENSEIYKFYQLLSLHGQSKDAFAKTKIGAWEYDIIGPWYKCNMTDIMAAIGLRQLDRYKGLILRREVIMKKYDKTCDELGLSHLYHHVNGMDSSNHLYLIRIPGIDVDQRNIIIEKMAELGVATNVHYKPLPMMTAYGRNVMLYPNSYDYYKNLITLPFHTLLTDEDVDYVCTTLKEVIREVKR